MTEPENFEDDLFADLYEIIFQAPVPAFHPGATTDHEYSYDDNEPAKTTQTQPAAAPPAAAPASYDTSYNEPAQITEYDGGGDNHVKDEEYEEDDDDVDFNLGNGTTTQHADTPTYSTPTPVAAVKGPNAKEDGKMFIGGLNWETTDQSLRDYFSQFGEVTECTVMRDGATGRSRGFGFLTFKDPKTVNIVMVKEHYLDGKIIDPKRAIPRDEQEKTSKIFVGGVSQDTTDAEFKDYFAQFGRVVDATLMMDKDTGRPRGFGFVTFESEAGVEATLSTSLEIHGKPIEVKKAQPRGNMREEEEANRRGGGKFGRKPGMGGSGGSQGDMDEVSGGQQGAAGGMTPQVMAQYWQRMQQYFAMMQQQMAMNRGMGGMGGMGGMNMNPAMMQMMQMQQMQQMMAAQGRGGGQGGNNPMAGMGNMNPQMMQQMMQQMQGAQGGQDDESGSQAGGNKPGYNAFEQQMFEQQKYDPSQGPRGPRGPRQDAQQQYGQGGYGMVGGGGGGAPTSWEGMYDDVPQPNFNQGGGRGGFHRNRGGAHQHQQGSMDTQHAPPANAPTGPKNAGRPGANYRGGGRGGGNRGFHPYGRG